MLGAEAVDRRLSERRLLAADALGRRGRAAAAALPAAVVRPASGEEVAVLLRLCAEAGVHVVPYGAGTGLMGGARSLDAGIVLDTRRLNRIDVSHGDRVVWAGAGAVLADVDAALAKHGLGLGHDPWTFPVATVGGALSTNGLGYRGGRYGGIGDQALALEVALADGALLRTKAVGRHSSGPDLARLFVGAEGTLGVITAAALRAFPRPETRMLSAFRFPGFEAGFRAIDAISALCLRPSLLDYGEEHASPWPDLVPRAEELPTLYLGFEGFEEEVEAAVARADAIVSAGGAEELPTELVERFWEERHVIAERYAGRRRRRRSSRWRSPDLAFDYLHVALPPSRVLEFQALCHAEPAASGVALLECGLWTGPELFSAQFVLPERLGGASRLNEMIDGLLRACQDMGGAMEYVHGAGLRYAGLMAREHGAGQDALRAIKRALDPGAILNPGKLGL